MYIGGSMAGGTGASSGACSRSSIGGRQKVSMSSDDAAYVANSSGLVEEHVGARVDGV